LKASILVQLLGGADGREAILSILWTTWHTKIWMLKA